MAINASFGEAWPFSESVPVLWPKAQYARRARWQLLRWGECKMGTMILAAFTMLIMLIYVRADSAQAQGTTLTASPGELLQL